MNQSVASFALTANTSNVVALSDIGTVTGASLTATGGTLATPTAGTSLYLNAANGGTLTLGSTTTAAAFSPWAVVTDATGTGFGALSAISLSATRRRPPRCSTTPNSGTTDFTTNPATDTAVGPPSQYDGTGTLTLAAGTHAADSLFINAAAPGTLALNGQTLSFASNALGMSGASNYTISGTGQLGTTAAVLDINQVGTGTLTIGSPISSGAGGLLKTGGGLVVLNGTSTYTGTVTVDNGALSIQSNGGSRARVRVPPWPAARPCKSAAAFPPLTPSPHFERHGLDRQPERRLGKRHRSANIYSGTVIPARAARRSAPTPAR